MAEELACQTIRQNQQGHVMVKGLAIFLILIFISAVAEAKALYVNGSTGNDSTTYANNDAGNPWLTIGRAAWGSTNRASPVSGEAAQAGDTVNIAAGTYNTSADTDERAAYYLPTNTGTVGNYITFQATGTVELTSTIPAPDGAVVSNGGTDYRCILDHMSSASDEPGVGGSWTTFWEVSVDTPDGAWVITTSYNAEDYTDGMPLIGSAINIDYIKWDGFTIKQENINYRGGNGVINVFGDFTTISNCEIVGRATSYPQGSDQHNAILSENSVVNVSGLLIENNKLHGFTGTGGRNDTAITVYWLNDEIIIRNNEIYDNQTGILSKTTDADSVSVLIHNNLFYNNTGDAISLQTLSNVKIYHNIMRDGGAGFQFFPTTNQEGTDRPKAYYVVNNTMDNLTWGIYINDGGGGSCAYPHDNFVKNNIITNVTYGVFTECGDTADWQTTDIDHDYNMYYTYTNFGFDSSSNFTFATWQGATYTQDANSDDSTDPLYVDEGDDNFRLQGGSQAINFGIDILDLDNDSDTGDPITIGAYITGNEQIGLLQGGGISIQSGFFGSGIIFN